MRYSLLTLTAVLAALVTASCAPRESGVDREAEAEAIMELEREWSDRFQAGDIDWIVERHAEDGRALPPGDEPAVGREAVRAFWTGLYETDGLSLSFGPTSAEVSRAGDMGYALGTYEMTLPDGSEDRGKYVVVWVKEDGEWRIAADIFNSNSPPGG